MSTATLAKPVSLTNESTLLPHSQPRTIDLKQAHLEAELDRHDLQYLDTAPITARPQGMTFKGISIE